ncbi:hypothetical protein EB796_024648 [Bugula neritina]|uniref:Uncharacterized protein n=1 Tax=Bugula neritina TaxID=10212 RepID=A0A7J7IUZ7_BUGNE|nr:hypothetical protein EB796_024648 [Bugula neritina]
MYIKHTYKLISFLIDVEPFKNLVMSTLTESADSPEHFSKLVRTMSITRHQVWKIEAATVKQSDSPLWKLLRHGRITASNFYQMKTRMESQDEDARTDMSKLVSLLTSPGDTSSVPSFQHGCSMEANAKQTYLDLNSPHHKKLIVGDCGLFLST